MAGYLYQARYALLRALDDGRRHPQLAISIERFDDVHFEDAGRPIELIQTKHHGTPGDMLDSSADLWKTLHIWLKRAQEDPIGAQTTRFSLLTTSTAPPGSALSMLRPFDDSRDTRNALRILISRANTLRNRATSEAREAFLSLDAPTRQMLVNNIWILDNTPNIVDMRSEIEALLHYSAPPEQVTILTDHLEGWWFNCVIASLTNRDHASIDLASVTGKVTELREEFKLANLFLDDEIESSDPNTHSSTDDRMFVRQMGLVRIRENEIHATIHDYYRAYRQRSRWARENLLLDGEVARYDRRLQDAWHRRFLACMAEVAEDCDGLVKEMRGREVFRWAREYQTPLRNRDEIWLSAGSLQMLSDELQVGWHPHFKDLLESTRDAI